MTPFILINVLFSALVVAVIVGGLAYSIVADRRLRVLGHRVSPKATPRSPGVTASPKLSGFNA